MLCSPLPLPLLRLQLSVAAVAVEAAAVEGVACINSTKWRGRGRRGGRGTGRERERESASEQVNITKLGSQLISLGPSDLAISPAIRKPMQMVKIQVKMRAGHSFNARTFCLM